jgi:mono/diheme cytochrome c family protein
MKRYPIDRRAGDAPHPPAGTFFSLGRGEGICGNVLAPSAFSPQAGRRCRQSDEGRRYPERPGRGHFIKLLPLILLLPLAACDDMSHQPRYESYEKSSLFADRKALQAPPDGTVAQDDPALAASLADRPAMSAALIGRGRDRFEIFCTPCHDASGEGKGTVPARGFPKPPSFHIDRLRKAPSRYFVEVITHGHGVMYSYADRVAPADRWAIAAYIRALQLSRHAPVAALTEAERRQLEESGS